MDDDVGAVVDGTDEITSCAEGVVDDEGDASVVGYLSNCVKVGDVVAWVANAFEVDSFGVLIDSGRDISGLVTLDELDLDA
jgi:hypothetical protein